MNLRHLLAAATAACATLVLGSGSALAHEKKDQLGKVTFATSCNAKAHAQFVTGVAMLHSYWFGEARKTFDAALKEDPNCAIAYWGIALDYLGNSLSAPPQRKNAEAAWQALEKARSIGAKTERERDYIEAISTYYRDHDKVPVNTRLLAYSRATEQLTQRYPDDFEAWVFYALNLQATAPKNDVKYTNQLKSAEILEKLLTKNPEHPGVVHFLIHAYDYPPLAEGNREQSENFMRSAADNEDGSVKHGAMENRLYPLRELYAELLLEIGQAAPALREFETALKAYRYRSIYGIARTADAAGDKRKAADNYNRLMALAKNADSSRPELARARAYVAQR